MAKTIHIRLSVASIENAINELSAYSSSLMDKGMQICNRLANVAELRVSEAYATLPYDGEKDYNVTVEPRDNGFAVVADGYTVLLLEFGAGVTYGFGHPLADDFGMGPGTYPGQKHAMQPQGWWLPDGGGHTYGNAPSMAMYYAGRDLRAEVETVAKEVFAS